MPRYSAHYLLTVHRADGSRISCMRASEPQALFAGLENNEYCATPTRALRRMRYASTCWIYSKPIDSRIYQCIVSSCAISMDAFLRPRRAARPRQLLDPILQPHLPTITPPPLRLRHRHLPPPRRHHHYLRPRPPHHLPRGPPTHNHPQSPLGP